MAVDIKNLSHNQLNELIAKAQTRQTELRREQVGTVRDKVMALIREEGFTFDDLFGARAPKSKRAGTVVAPKFRNPDDSEQTWSGRGKRPRWFNEALAAGKKEADLLV